MAEYFINIGKRTLPVREGQSVHEALRSADMKLMVPCGGRGTCGKCRIRVLQGHLSVTEADRAALSPAELESGIRLSCRAYPDSDITIELLNLKEDDFHSLDSFENFGITPDEYTGQASEPFGIAVDIGTTTLGLCMVHLKTGQIAGRWSAVNMQREYGADVVTRIDRATKGDLLPMRDSIRAQLSKGITALFNQCKTADKQLERVVIAGNTTMLHLLLGLDCSTLGFYPFTPVTLDALTFNYNELFEGPFGCRVEILPGISTYVGADVTAGIIYSGLHLAERPSLLVDIGTNGEMALGSREGIVCTSTAAGPAFEGANIKWGTGSIPGAISSVIYENGRFNIKTIDDKPPIGICGSGILDAVFQSVKHNKIAINGRLDKAYTSREIPLAAAPDNQPIALTQKDIRELQLGKSAISSGIHILLDYAGVKAEDVETLYLAGGFGCHLRPESAFGIGMLPEPLLHRTVPLGNSSLGGCVYTLLKNTSAGELESIARGADEFSLSERKEFNQLFLENTSFRVVY